MKKILIIDDDFVILQMYYMAFKAQNFDVIMANEGVEGFTKAEETIPDIILMDVMMPKMNGIETLARIKASEKLKNIPVIMLSNISDQLEMNNSIKLGAVKYLVKSNYIPSQVVTFVKGVIGVSATPNV